jgi:hypothetical protein
MVTTWDLIDHRWTGDAMLSPSDPEFRTHLDDAYAGLVDRLEFIGVPRVVFIRQPVPDVWWIPAVQEEDEPERHQVLYDVYAALEAARPGVVDVVDFAGWFTHQGYDGDHDMRPDGVHLDSVYAERVVDEYLADRLIRAALGQDVA